MSTLEKLIEEEYRKRYLELEVADEEDDVDADIKPVINAFKKWLAGKLVAGSEKANAYNDVILKLLHELKEKEVEQK